MILFRTVDVERMRRGNRRRLVRGRWTQEEIDRIWREAHRMAEALKDLID